MRRSLRGAVSALALLSLAAGQALAASDTFPVTFSAPAGVANTMTVSDASGTAQTNYPLQFGRPFVQGAIPSGQLPVVSVNGVAVPTQADVKNRYPDGSVEFAVLSLVVPNIPANGSVALTFAPGTTDSNTPLTQAQMLDASYNFDAAMTLVKNVPGTLTGTPPNIPADVTNGGFVISVNGTPEAVSGINLSSAVQVVPATVAQPPGTTPNLSNSIQLAALPPHVALGWGVIDLTNPSALPSNAIVSYLCAVGGCGNAGATIYMSSNGNDAFVQAPGVSVGDQIMYVNYAGIASAISIPGATVSWNGTAFVVKTTATGATATLSDATAPTDGAQDLSIVLGLSNGSLTAGSSASGSASARQMLSDGNYTVWTSGPVAQTIILGDNSPIRKYDIGFGDGYHPFRPHFEATFWPATHQVFVRAIGENDLSTELEDISYTLNLTGGQTAPAAIETNLNLAQDAMATWDKTFWLGSTPQPEVNIDNNLAYLESTRYVPNYDMAVRPLVTQADLAADYTLLTQNGTDIGDAGSWNPGMPTTGARLDIGPQPAWDALWLMTGDWRMRQVSLTDANLAAWWPANTRETDTTERLLTSDPKPVAPAVGTGYGHPVSITDRVQLGPSAGGEYDFVTYNSDNPNPPNKLDVVGPLNYGSPNGWTFDVAHEPSPFFVPYILTGDPFYLGEMENWAAYDMAANQGYAARGLNQGRGPTGAEGGLFDQLRGDGWGLVHRAEAAFAEPDGAPEKTWLTEETNSDIARWDGALGVTGDAFAGTPEYVWAQQTGDPESRSGNSPAPPLGNWEDSLNVGLDGGGQYLPGLVDRGSTNQWMQWYVQYAIGRVHELGFADGPLVEHSGAFLTNEINTSGYPELIAAYQMPTSFTVGGLIPDWPTMIADLNPAYLTGAGWAASCGSDCTVQGPLPTFFGSQHQLYPQGYDAYAQAALATLVDDGAPGAAQAWTWMKSNVRDPLLAEGNNDANLGYSDVVDPTWAIVPRTDTNVLPTQPTTQP